MGEANLYYFTCLKYLQMLFHGFGNLIRLLIIGQAEEMTVLESHNSEPAKN